MWRAVAHSGLDTACQFNRSRVVTLKECCSAKILAGLADLGSESPKQAFSTISGLDALKWTIFFVNQMHLGSLYHILK